MYDFYLIVVMDDDVKIVLSFARIRIYLQFQSDMIFDYCPNGGDLCLSATG